MPASEEQMLRSQSKFVFQGTVQGLGSSTLPNVKPDKSLAIVTVDAIEEGPPAMQAFQGKPITVRLNSNETVEENEHATFYTNPWIFGESLAVSSVGHTPVHPGAAALTASANPIGKLLRSGVEARIADADAVVTGKVLSVHLPGEDSDAGTQSGRATLARSTSTAAPGQQRISEHNPLWRDAVVEITDVQKGEKGKRRVIVRFPSSEDVRWHRAPKFQPGQEGVFILHKAENQAAPAMSAMRAASGRGFSPAEIYTTLNANDFHPVNQAQAIRLLTDAQPSRTQTRQTSAAAARPKSAGKGRPARTARTASKTVMAKAAAKRKVSKKASRKGSRPTGAGKGR